MLTSRRYPIGYLERNQFLDRSLAAPPENHSFQQADLSGIFLFCPLLFSLNISFSENLFSWNYLLNRRWQENGDGYSADAFLSSFFFSHFKSPRRSKLIGRSSLEPLTIPIGAFWELSTCFWPKGMFEIVRLREYTFPPFLLLSAGIVSPLGNACWLLACYDCDCALGSVCACACLCVV